MPAFSATSLAHPNIAFIKYWGNRDNALRLPANGSISMNLDGLATTTQVTFDGLFTADSLTVNGHFVSGPGLERVSTFLDLVRKLAGIDLRAEVISQNNFPTGVGIASSAAAFAALALASSRAAGLDLEPAALSRLARRGSGSACRSVPGGFVEWLAGTADADSYAISLAPADHWQLADCIVILSTEQKSTGSSEGNTLAGTSLLQTARVEDAPRRLELCRRAILSRDFAAFAEIVELDSNLMHAVMMTSTPPLFYWREATLTVLRSVREARLGGWPICSTVDAGPNVHVITEDAEARRVVEFLGGIPGVQKVRLARVGGPARLIE